MPALNRVMADHELQRMVQLYLQAETDIINEMGRLRSMGLVDYHAQAALDRVQAILHRLEADDWEYVQVDIDQRLTMNLMGELTEAHATVYSTLESALIGRAESDVFRRVGLEQTGLAQAMGRGPFRAAPGFVEALRREGVTAFVDRAGRNWSLHTYASMVLRTTSRQAEVLSVLTQDPQWDLYKVSRHGTTCKLCAPFEGRVYSKSGRDPDFPPLSAAFGKMDPSGPDDLTNSWLNIHPNCLHQLIRWTPMGRSEEELKKIKDFSSFTKNPPTRDPRTQQQMDAYRKKERNRARWLNEYRQWEHYRETLGNAVPKTFQTFQRHKAAGDEKYKLWRLDYRRQNELLRHPERALPGAATAAAAEAKFTKYFFNPENEKGRHKGDAFSSRLGYNINNWPLMQQEILMAATRYPAFLRGHTAYGDSYSQDVILYGLKGKPANVQIGWMVHPGGAAHLVTAHMEGI